MRFPALIIAVIAAVCLTSLSARAEKAPDFSDYKVAPFKYNEAKAVDLTSHPKARMMRTRLTEGFKKPADLAQKYVVVMHGCGSSCQVYWAINKETGKVLGGVGSTYGAEYRKDSSLLIANPLPTKQADLSEEENKEYLQVYKHMVGGPRYYVIEKDELKLILDNSKKNEDE